MTTRTAPDEALVRAAIEQVWGSMMFAAVEPWPADRPSFLGTGLRATIELRGDWNGRLTIACATEAAAAIAAAMVGTPAGALPAEDVHDALGEVVNVVGGSVKGALDGTLALGLPEVLPCTGVPVDGFVLAWDGAPLFVQVDPAPA